MGNSHATGLLSSGDHPYQLGLGGGAGLLFGGRNVEQHSNGEIRESWAMQYKVRESSCGFVLSKTKGDHKLDICIRDETHGVSSEGYVITVRRGGAGLLQPSCISQNDLCIVGNLTTSATNAWGGITETSIDIYGRGTRKGLVVREWKKKRNEENPYTGTVAHYYANSQNGNDVGLSVVVKRIRVLDNGNLDFVVDGPMKHPVRALFYMFDEVLRIKTWKPFYCPHCAIAYINLGQFESEGSDADDLSPAPLLRGLKHSAGGKILANDGNFKGDNNGNLIIKHFHAGRR